VKNEPKKEAGEEDQEIQIKDPSSDCQEVSEDRQWQNHAYQGEPGTLPKTQVKKGKTTNVTHARN
jgi:hypothetical protein